MTCPTCERWAATTVHVWTRRQRSIGRGNPYICPDCRTSDWVYTRAFLPPDSRRPTVVVSTLLLVAICVVAWAAAYCILVK
jgi:hypothetical protein